ncbi:MAG: aspartate-semialdehyde dehydrogenase [Bradymonadia bacterium]|jgi:aspartate-semialdehyde dehydrogenase
MQEALNIGIVGATGAVGQEILRCLELLDFPIKKLLLMASARSKGKRFCTKWGEFQVENAHDADFQGLDIVFFSAGKDTSLALAQKALHAGAYVIDNTSAFRMQANTALVVPEVNAHEIPKKPSLIANPNCSTIQLVLALKAIHDAAGLRSVRVATYQSCSGAGQKGIDALIDETKTALNGTRLSDSTVHARGIAFDVVPQIGAFLSDGYSEEELKMMQETQKILALPELAISATCVRVPVLRGHSEAVFVTTRKKLSTQEAKNILANAKGLVLSDLNDPSQYPTATQADGKLQSYVGRVRQDYADPNGICFWLVSDNLLKGAALNAVQIAQYLLNLNPST